MTEGDLSAGFAWQRRDPLVPFDVLASTHGKTSRLSTPQFFHNIDEIQLFNDPEWLRNQFRRPEREHSRREHLRKCYRYLQCFKSIANTAITNNLPGFTFKTALGNSPVSDPSHRFPC